MEIRILCDPTLTLPLQGIRFSPFARGSQRGYVPQTTSALSTLDIRVWGQHNALKRQLRAKALP